MTDKTITDLVDDLVEQNTFSLEAIDGVKALRDRVKEVEKNRDMYMRLYSDYSGQVATLEKQVTAFTEAETKMAAREAAARKLELEAAVSNAALTAYKDIVTKMFANRQTRESLITNHVVPSNQPGGFPQQFALADSVSKTEE